MIIKTRNILSETAPFSALSSTESAGTTVFRIKNTSGFGSQWAIQIGETGHEQTEVRLLSGTPSATLATVTAVSTYEHPADTPVYAIKYNQVIFERSTAGTAGTATPITGGTVTYQADSFTTQFDDTTGATTYAYRARYVNANIGSTSQSDWMTPTGFTYYSLASLRDRVKDKLWDSSFIKQDITIDNWINEWREELVNAAIEANEDYSLGTVAVGFGTSGLGTITTANFAEVRRFEVTYDGVNSFLSTKAYQSEFTPSQVFSQTHPYHKWLGDNVFQVLPGATAGTATLTYYQFGTVLSNDTDELPQPMKRFTKGFVDYAKLQAQYKDGKVTQEQLDAFTTVEKQKFVKSLSPRDQSGPQLVQIVEAVQGEMNLD